MEKDGLLIRLGKEVLLQKLKKNLYDIVNSDNIIKDMKLTPNTRFREDLGMDSFDKYGFGYKMEEELGIDISDGKMQELNSINEYITYLDENHS